MDPALYFKSTLLSITPTSAYLWESERNCPLSVLFGLHGCLHLRQGQSPLITETDNRVLLIWSSAIPQPWEAARCGEGGGREWETHWARKPVTENNTNMLVKSTGRHANSRCVTSRKSRTIEELWNILDSMWKWVRPFQDFDSSTCICFGLGRLLLWMWNDSMWLEGGFQLEFESACCNSTSSIEIAARRGATGKTGRKGNKFAQGLPQENEDGFITEIKSICHTQL